MDFEKERRHQKIRLIVTEIIMVLAVVAVVAILVLVVSGYWINENFEVSRSGMLQITSVPKGATVAIDENVLSQHTDLSRVVPTGEHTITLSKEGYDNWTKTVDIKEGLLYRLQYPILFPEERKIEKTELDSKVSRISFSPKHDQALLINNSAVWSIINLEDEKIDEKEIDLTSVFNSPVVEVLSLTWSANQNRVLVNVRYSADKTEWILVDLNNVSRSVNLSAEFGLNFSEFMIADNSADTLLALRDKALQKINLNDKSISVILVDGVQSLSCRDDEIMFVASDKENGFYIGVMKLSNTEPETLFSVKDSAAKVFASSFYDAKYLFVVDGSDFNVYKRDDLENPENEFKLSFVPEKVVVSLKGDYIVLSNGVDLATLDMEFDVVREWKIEKAEFGWLGEGIIYTVDDGNLIVYDFDGLNRRVVTSGVKSDFPSVVAGKKWLYYVSENNLVREALNN